jgi:hypothetical protein
VIANQTLQTVGIIFSRKKIVAADAALLISCAIGLQLVSTWTLQQIKARLLSRYRLHFLSS